MPGFDLESCSDVLVLFDGTTSDSPIIFDSCESMPGMENLVLYSTGPEMLIIFNTDDYDDGPRMGFIMNVTAIDPDEGTNVIEKTLVCVNCGACCAYLVS